jgi:hypothetical protein
MLPANMYLEYSCPKQGVKKKYLENITCERYGVTTVSLK